MGTRLKDKVCIITGACKGIGKGVTERYLDEGAIVVACGHTQEQADELVREIKSREPDARIEAAAPVITDYASVKECVDRTIDTYGRLDVVAPIAGITDYVPFEEYTPERFDKVMDVNVRGSFNFCLASVKQMEAQESGVIILTTSTVAISGGGLGMAYPTSKFAVRGMMLSLAKELAPKGVRVNAVLPGYIHTPMTTSLPKEIIDPIIASLPIPRWGKVDEITGAYVFLAEDENSWCTATEIEVEGMTRFS